MLTLANVGNSKVAATYYESADDYYTGDRSPSLWQGSGAANLGLQGVVEPADFAALLEGILPNGETLHHAAAGRRGGTDATFSAPKSVSMQALIGGDERVIEAHSAAVARTLAFAEQFAACRVTKGGVTQNERTGNFLSACFKHILSRATDPQLHTHCVILNATRRLDGQWRAMDNQALYRNKMLLGALYRNELASELQTLGYAIRKTHIDGRFELAHITDQQVKAFSRRSVEIETFLKERHGLERSEATAWDKRLIAVSTRAKKGVVDRELLRSEWEKLSEEQGIGYNPPEPLLSQDVRITAETVLEQAIEHIAERSAVFPRFQLLQAALAFGVGNTCMAEIEACIAEAVHSGRLIQDGERFTTSYAQQLERDILEFESLGRGVLAPIYQGKRVVLHKQLEDLSEGQRAAVLSMLLTKNQIIGIQGRAGVGKTTLLEMASEQARACGYIVKGLAPSASAARELARVGIMSETITAFTHRQSKGLNNNTLLIVDEAGMVSTHQMHAILREAANAGCRVVLVGDTAQLQAVEAGKPFAQMQAKNMHTAVVSQIQRQKNRKLKCAVELAVGGQTAMAVELLDKEITELVDATERFERIANDYVSLPEQERASTRIIAGTRYARNAINCSIRAKLTQNSPAHQFTFLDRKDQTKAQAHSILSYEIDDILLAEADYPSLGLKRGDMTRILGRRHDCVLLASREGEPVEWRPALTANLTVFVAVERAVAEGDRLRITSNDRKRGLINGDLATVIAIDAKRQVLTLLIDGGSTVELDGRQPLALDYGYCSTVHASQGQTCDRVLIEADANSLTANENTFYVAISRARYEVKIYTDDHEMLPLSMSRELVKEAALDLPSADLAL